MRLEPHATYRLCSDDVVHFGGDGDGFTVRFSTHSLDLSGTSFPRGSLSISKSKSFCDRLHERIREEEDDRARREAIKQGFKSWAGGRVECGVATLTGRNKKESEDRWCVAEIGGDGCVDDDERKNSGRYVLVD